MSSNLNPVGTLWGDVVRAGSRGVSTKKTVLGVLLAGLAVAVPGRAAEAEPSHKDFAQWGLTQDDVGRMFYSSAGMEQPAFGFQIPRAYGKVALKDELAPGFMEPWPIMATPDVQGGPGRLRPDKTLNHFTASCGQSVYRGDNLPKDFYGDLFIPEPVGRGFVVGPPRRAALAD